MGVGLTFFSSRGGSGEVFGLFKPFSAFFSNLQHVFCMGDPLGSENRE